ncbi:MAG TPA: DNA polymerase III subunit beta [Candidatus Saccharimonadales bacterium]|nr:DNA polymerase III subunit beta [Candidatus Saccharimonadales bacterium]
MKLSVTQENLTRALGVVGRVVSSRSSLPVLGNVLLSTDSSRLKLSATNLEIGVNCWIGSKVEADGAITVPARLFSEFVASLPGGNIELASDNLGLVVKTPHYQSRINGISADEFPLIPKLKSRPTLTIPSAQFREALLQTTIAASLDESRPVLAGVYLYVEDGSLLVVATDSYRLAERKLKLKDLKPDTKLSIIVPARTMQELARMLAEAETDLSIYLGDNQIMFEVDNLELTSRLIDGQFPNYRQIIPDKTETAIEIDTAEFSRITKVASLFARENAGGVRLEIKQGGQVSIISTASQLGDNTSTADCLTKGGDGEISLNARYLTEALAAIKSPQVEFAVSGKLNPCVIKPLDDKKHDEYLHIIMPLRT